MVAGGAASPHAAQPLERGPFPYSPRETPPRARARPNLDCLPMRTYDCRDWTNFERLLDRYFQNAGERRAQWIFRGEPNAARPLLATIDRDRTFKDTRERDSLLNRYLNEFQRQCTGLTFPHGVPDEPREWELLARHHGLPSAVLDWTFSPYVAAFFAFARPGPTTPESVAIWAFDRAFFEADTTASERWDDPIEIWDDHAVLQVNPRAVEQASVFMRVNRQVPPPEAALASHLTKFTLPLDIRPEALRRLAAMGITARRMFRDLDHAARTARWVVEEA